MTDRRDSRTPRPARSLTFAVPPRGGGAPYLESSLTEAELVAIGRIAVQWSQLEKIVFDMTHTACALLAIEMPPDTLSLSFTRRSGALREVLEKIFADDESSIQELSFLFGKIGRNEDKRHKVVHGLWDHDLDGSEGFVVWNDRMPNIRPEKMDLKKLQGFASDIAETNYNLTMIKLSMAERLSFCASI